MDNVESFVARQVISGLHLRDLPPEVREHWLEGVNRQMQMELGIGIVDQLWKNPGKPMIIKLDAWESSEQSFYRDRHMNVRAQFQPIHMHRMGTPYYMPELIEEIHIPHFRYFPADWVCMKCGCINSGLKDPRMCPHCNAPRDAKIAMEEAKLWSQLRTR